MKTKQLSMRISNHHWSVLEQVMNELSCDRTKAVEHIISRYISYEHKEACFERVHRIVTKKEFDVNAHGASSQTGDEFLEGEIDESLNFIKKIGIALLEAQIINGLTDPLAKGRLENLARSLGMEVD